MEAPQDKCIQVLLVNGFSENSILKALYALHNSEGRLIVLLYMHVDDLLWAAEPEAEPIIEQLLSEFSLRKSSMRMISPSPLHAGKTTLKVKSIFIAHSRKQHPADVSNTSGHSRHGLARGHNKRRGAVELKCPGGLLRLPSHGWE